MARRTDIFAVLAAIIALALLSFPSHGQDLQQRRSRLEKDIAILQSQISSSTSRSEQAISSLSLIQAQASSRRKLVKESDNQIARLSGQIYSVQKEINHQQAVLDTLESHYDRLVLGAYKNRDVKIWYMYILSSETISQALRRFGYFKNLSSQLKRQAEEIEEVKNSLKSKKSDLMALRSKAAVEKKRRAKELDKIKADEARQSKLVTQLKKNTAEYRKSLQAKQKEMKAINEQIAKMIGNASSKKKPVDYVLSQNFEQNKGKLPWPVDGPVAEHYGAYQNKQLKLSLFNNGITIACEQGSTVRSVFDGVVSNIMIAPGYGQCILVQHGEYYTTYCKIKTASVKQGDKVKTGQKIGEVATIMGKTQLYFLVWKKQYLDPEIWLRER